MKLTTKFPRTISEMLATYGERFYAWQSENIASGAYSQNSFRRDRYSRCYDAAEHGSDGSTHAETIDDFRKFGCELFREFALECFRYDWPSDAEDNAHQAKIDEAEAAYSADCDRCEQWHAQNGSLDQQCG